VPVICLDWGGPGEMVGESTGIKIPVSTPEKAIAALAAAFLRLENNPALRHTLAAAARARSQAVFSWQAKRDILTATYRRLIGES
jgi:glycosyltransferase involved in cell wall biosynthesis